MKKNFLVLGLFCLTTFAACDSDRRTAQNEGYQDTEVTTTADNTTTGIQEDSREFVKKAASSSMMEVELGKIAQEKATNKEVKDLADMIVKDHTQANEKLKSTAQTKNIELPATLMEDHQEKVTKFRDMKKGAEFDKEYVSMLNDAHEKDISNFEDAQEDVQDQELKQWVSNTLPTLKKHKEHIERVKNTLDK